MPLNEKELIWAAGFFDGEGHISVGSTRPQIQMRISQFHVEPLQRFQLATGGFGKFYSPKVRPIWQWVAWNQEAVDVAKEIFPFLCSIKQNQITKVIEKRRKFQEEMTLKTGRGRTFKELTLCL